MADHKMKLNQESFDLIKSGKKTIEVRLFDKKRKKIEIGDSIEFTKLPDKDEKLLVKVQELLIYKRFIDLFSDFPSNYFTDVKLNRKELVRSMRKYYSISDEEKYGVLGIKISLIN